MLEALIVAALVWSFVYNKSFFWILLAALVLRWLLGAVARDPLVRRASRWTLEERLRLKARLKELQDQESRWKDPEWSDEKDAREWHVLQRHIDLLEDLAVDLLPLDPFSIGFDYRGSLDAALQRYKTKVERLMEILEEDGVNSYDEWVERVHGGPGGLLLDGAADWSARQEGYADIREELIAKERERRNAAKEDKAGNNS